MGGLRPFVEFMTFNFAMQAIDHIINSAAKTNYMSGGQMRCPIVFRGPNGAAARVAAQHSQNYGSWYANVPGLVVIAPYSAADAKGLLKAAIRTDDPVVFLENELLYGQHFDVPQLDDYVLPIGKARVVRPGKDVTIVSYSIGVGVALEAAQELIGQGISAEVIDLRTLRPLDKTTVLESASSEQTAWWWSKRAGRSARSVRKSPGDRDDRRVRRSRRPGHARKPDIDVPLPYAANLEENGADQGVQCGRGGEGRLLSLSASSITTGWSRARTAASANSGPPFSALWNLDLAFADVVATSSDAHLGAIRLAWWRERLEQLDEGKASAGEPRLPCGREPVARPRCVSGNELSQLEDAWLPILEPFSLD